MHHKCAAWGASIGLLTGASMRIFFGPSFVPAGRCLRHSCGYLYGCAIEVLITAIIWYLMRICIIASIEVSIGSSMRIFFGPSFVPAGRCLRHSYRTFMCVRHRATHMRLYRTFYTDTHKGCYKVSYRDIHEGIVWYIRWSCLVTCRSLMAVRYKGWYKVSYADTYKRSSFTSRMRASYRAFMIPLRS